MKEIIEYNTAYEAVKVNDDDKRKCYPCSGLGYHIEATREYDGSLYKEKIACACCDGVGAL